MKTILKTILLLVIGFFSSLSMYAQMDNLSNMSAEWIRTGARNAATDASDIVVYNPAGLTKLSDGIHINMSNQTLFRSPSHSYDLGLGQGMKTFTQYGSDPFLPNLYAAYKKNNWAFYTGAFMTGGGATMNYPTGSITTDLIALQALNSAGGAYTDMKSQHLKASSMYLTTTVGSSYSINTMISISFAVRYLSAKNTTEAGFTMTASPYDLPDQPLNLNTEEKANGAGFVASVFVSPTDKFNFSARYESRVKLDFKTKTITDDLGASVNGQMNRRDLPAVLALGVSYKVTPEFSAYGDYNYYFQKNANWGTSTEVTSSKPWSAMAGNASTVAAGFQYACCAAFTASMGCGYTMYDYADKAGYYTKPGTFEVMQDNNYNINTGFAWKASKHITFNGGYMHTFWAKDQKVQALNAQPLDAVVTINNALDAVAVGLDITF
jgi:long-chain fatty acid transport protein